MKNFESLTEIKKQYEKNINLFLQEVIREIDKYIPICAAIEFKLSAEIKKSEIVVRIYDLRLKQNTIQFCISIEDFPKIKFGYSADNSFFVNEFSDCENVNECLMENIYSYLLLKRRKLPNLKLKKAIDFIVNTLLEHYPNYSISINKDSESGKRNIICITTEYIPGEKYTSVCIQIDPTNHYIWLNDYYFGKRVTDKTKQVVDLTSKKEIINYVENCAMKYVSTSKKFIFDDDDENF